MNKIYLEPVEKAKSLIEGVNKQSDLLAKHGICIDVERLNRLCDALYEAGLRQEEAEMGLKEARDAAHKLLDELKDFYAASKLPIKQNFPQYGWIAFGVVDKK